MEYSVADFVRLLQQLKIDLEEVLQVSYAWGNGNEDSGGWTGGFCFVSLGGIFYRACRTEFEAPYSAVCSLSEDKPFAPIKGVIDFVVDPPDIREWLSSGARIDDRYQF